MAKILIIYSNRTASHYFTFKLRERWGINNKIPRELFHDHQKRSISLIEYFDKYSHIDPLIIKCNLDMYEKLCRSGLDLKEHFDVFILLKRRDLDAQAESDLIAIHNNYWGTLSSYGWGSKLVREELKFEEYYPSDVDIIEKANHFKEINSRSLKTFNFDHIFYFEDIIDEDKIETIVDKALSLSKLKKYKDHYTNKDLIMWVDLSTYCNAACPQCHRTNPDGLDKSNWLPLIQWSFEYFKKSFPVESMKRFSKFELCGTWGDPIMNKDIFKIIKYVIQNSNCKIMINTNGSIRTPDWWWDLGILCGDRLNVTFDIDGINQEQHSKYRRKTSLSLVLDNLITISSTKTKTRVFTVVFKHNQDDLYEIALLAKENGAETVFFVPSNRFHHSGGESNKFKFINEDSKDDSLEQSTFDEFGDIFWRDLYLNNEKDLKRIKDFKNE